MSIYRYICGTCPVDVSNSGSGVPFGKHHILLLGNDTFEYGTNGYERHRGVGRESKYNWSNNLPQGVTGLSPDFLDKMIIKNREWTADKYNPIFHNCQHFVHWCTEWCERIH